MNIGLIKTCAPKTSNTKAGIQIAHGNMALVSITGACGHVPDTCHSEAGLQIAHGDMALVSATWKVVDEPV